MPISNAPAPSLRRKSKLLVSKERFRALDSVATLVGILLVGAAGALIALGYKAILHFATTHLFGAQRPGESFLSIGWPLRFGLVSFALLLGAKANSLVKAHSQRDLTDAATPVIGLSAVASTVQGPGTGPVLGASLARGTINLFSTIATCSIGRESAIMEVGAAFGVKLANLVQRFKQTKDSRLSSAISPTLAPTFALAGVAGAFSAAYHAPIGAVVYCAEHLGSRIKKRYIWASAIAALTARLLSVNYLHSAPLFSSVKTTNFDVLKLGLIGIFPAYLGSVVFVNIRHLIASKTSDKKPRYWTYRACAALLAGAIAAIAPKVAGNGAQGIRESEKSVAIALIATLAIAKLFATAASFGTTSPIGVFSPSMAVASGWALGFFHILKTLGVPMPTNLWTGVIGAMAVGLAISVDLPLVAIVAVAEMTGNLWLFPQLAVVVGVATLLKRRAAKFCLVMTNSRGGPLCFWIGIRDENG